jgi:dTDP-4-amino-4,6-dideoxygalactose transaminase
MDGITIFGGPDGVDAAVGEDHDNFWLTSILVEETMTGWSVEDLRLHLGQADIEARPLWKPMHLQPVFADRPAYTNGTSERLFRTGLSLPSGSVLTDDQFERVLEHIQSFVAARS